MMNHLKNERGQSLVEFTLILPLVILTLMGILEFGIMLNAYMTINHAAKEGARLGALGSSDSDITSQVISDSINLNQDNIIVNITPSQSLRESGETVTVTVDYDYQVMMPIISSIINNSVRLEANTSMRVE